MTLEDRRMDHLDKLEHETEHFDDVVVDCVFCRADWTELGFGDDLPDLPVAYTVAATAADGSAVVIAEVTRSEVDR